jgi:hypothetical protein
MMSFIVGKQIKQYTTRFAAMVGKNRRLVYYQPMDFP